MNHPVSIGKSITDAVQFVSKLGAECERLADLIKEEISRALLTPALVKRYKANGAWVSTRTTDEHDWVYTGVGISLPIAAKPKRLTSSFIVVQISLAGEGIAAHGNQEPLIHIGQWGTPVDFDNIMMGFPCATDSGHDLSLEHDRVFRWSHRDYEDEWCYSVRLTDINNPDDVQTQIINPLTALLSGASASQALKERKAVQYNELANQPGHYRIIDR